MDKIWLGGRGTHPLVPPRHSSRRTGPRIPPPCASLLPARPAPRRRPPCFLIPPPAALLVDPAALLVDPAALLVDPAALLVDPAAGRPAHRSRHRPPCSRIPPTAALISPPAARRRQCYRPRRTHLLVRAVLLIILERAVKKKLASTWASSGYRYPPDLAGWAQPHFEGIFHRIWLPLTSAAFEPNTG
jgi:hypothetical protein